MGDSLREQEDNTIIPAAVNDDFKPLITKEQYEILYRESIEHPEAFWAKQAEHISWIKTWDSVKHTSFDDDVSIQWFKGAQLNVCYNCVDRHLEARGDQTAIIWEGDEPTEDKHISYKELYSEVCRFANLL